LPFCPLLPPNKNEEVKFSFRKRKRERARFQTQKICAFIFKPLKYTLMKKKDLLVVFKTMEL
jgi:hypothetical protein